MPVILVTLALVLLAGQVMAPKPPAPPRPLIVVASDTFLLPQPNYELLLTKRELLWQVFSPQVMDQYWIEDFKALKDAWKSKRLVALSDNPSQAGFILRKKRKGPNQGPIAEKETDPKRREFYYGLEKAAAGLLFELRDYLQGAEGEAYSPLELTSLVRSWEYQKKLAKTNNNAKTTAEQVPPTHVLGLAFDISRLGMSKMQEGLIEGFATEQAMKKRLISFTEGKDQWTFHFIVRPEAKDYYENYYDKAIGTN